MHKALLLKLLTIGGLILLLMLPLYMIDGIIDDRQSHRIMAAHDIAQSWTGPQKLTGGILVVPYKEKVIRNVEVFDDGKKQTVEKEKIRQRYKYILPETLKIQGRIDTQERYRGIYKVPVYTANTTIEGRFHLEENLGISENLNNIEWQKPYIVFGIQDIRGINQSVQLRINGENVDLLPGAQSNIAAQGLHSVLEIKPGKAASFDFDMSMELQGMESLSFLPTGKLTEVQLTSPWQHPRFEGRFLPKTREISQDGFHANWETSIFASNMQKHLDDCVTQNQCHMFHNNAFGVSLLQGVDIYLQAERSVKYALLFLVLTFVVFFLFEILKSLRIHTIQYGLVGVALALFYLLLISLSEHIAFGLAYIIASIACIGIISFYVSYILKSARRASVFALTLSGLYGALYMLLRSEDYALLMGSILLFGILSFIMVMTRKIDWYQIETNNLRPFQKKENS